jgi:hypothetical protein
MRPTASFTLHAILAACLAALAASSAAAGSAGDGDSQGFFQMRLGTSAADNRGQHLEVQSYHWGPRQTTSADGSRTRAGNQVILDDTPGGAAAKERQAGMKELTAEPGKSEAGGGLDSGMKQLEAKEKMGDSRTGHSMLGASEKITVDSARTESNAEGKYRTLRPRPLDAPLPANGSLVVQASGGTCRVGARYPSITLSGRGKSYLLQDVEVVDCGVGATGAQFTLVYRKVTVKGWNPEKKEL